VASNFTGYQIVCPNVKSSAEEDAEWIPKTLQRIAALGNIHSPKLDHSALLCLRVRSFTIGPCQTLALTICTAGCMLYTGTHTQHRIETAGRVGLRLRVQSGFTWRTADIIDTGTNFCLHITHHLILLSKSLLSLLARFSPLSR
jgi:hypothetical protein